MGLPVTPILALALYPFTGAFTLDFNTLNMATWLLVFTPWHLIDLIRAFTKKEHAPPAPKGQLILNLFIALSLSLFNVFYLPSLIPSALSAILPDSISIIIFTFVSHLAVNAFSEVLRVVLDYLKRFYQKPISQVRPLILQTVLTMFAITGLVALFWKTMNLKQVARLATATLGALIISGLLGTATLAQTIIPSVPTAEEYQRMSTEERNALLRQYNLLSTSEDEAIQLAVIRGYVQMGDPDDAGAALTRLLRSSRHETVRLAAINALETLGVVSSTSWLIDAIAKETSTRQEIEAAHRAIVGFANDPILRENVKEA